MSILFKYRPVFLIMALLALLAAACSVETPEPTALPTSLPEPTDVDEVEGVTPTPTSSPDVAPTSTPAPYDPNATMYRLFSRFAQLTPSLDTLEEPRRREAIEAVRQNGDVSQVPVLIEILRFLPNSDTRESAAEVLREFTNQEYGGDDWREWSQWYGRNSEDFPPPEDYLNWKIAVLSQISPLFGSFLRPAQEFSAIDTTEIQWGGVLPDGIPDLQNPPHIQPDEADYLGWEERVFGISINGEHRAYPLRITNPHEMVNDTLGGEPIALSW